MPKIIAIQGVAGAFHETAAQLFFGKDISVLECETFADAFAALENKTADFAVCGIENSFYGFITATYDLLLTHPHWICGEIYLRIEQCLMGLPETMLSEIREVHSQIMALSQTAEYLDTFLPQAERIERHDTAASAADIAKWHDPTKVAIASAAAAKQYGLSILKRGIETNHHNYTRFIVLSPEEMEVPGANKTTIILETPHSIGALHEALGAFAKENVNLTSLTSKAIIGHHKRYMFYLDFEAGLHEDRTKRALQYLDVQGCKVRVLGSYKAVDSPAS